ncbi:MAG: PqiC family protein [Desulfobacterales bacterium]|nr:PqiC family protein [Desulfobacterales bacterium]
MILRSIRTTTWFGGIALVFILVGCSLKGPSPQRQFHFIPPVELAHADPGMDRPQSSRTQSSRPPSARIQIRPLAIAPAFDTHFFTYRMGETELTPDFTHLFAAGPGPMVTNVITQALFQLPGLTRATPPLPPEFRLSGTLVEIYGDFRSVDHPWARISLDLHLEQRTPRGYVTRIQDRFTREIPLAASAPQQLGPAWSKALEQILLDFLEQWQAMSPPNS